LFKFFFTESINNDTVLILANAVHFKSGWAHQFEHVYDGFFYVTPNNKVTVKMMHLEHGFRYYHDNDLKFAALELPYKVNIALYLMSI